MQILKYFESEAWDPNCLGQASPLGATRN